MLSISEREFLELLAAGKITQLNERFNENYQRVLASKIKRKYNQAEKDLELMKKCKKTLAENFWKK